MRGLDPAHSEPRLRDAHADRGSHRCADRGRRVERRDRGAGCREPDDGPRGEGPRVPGCLRREHVEGRERSAQARSASSSTATTSRPSRSVRSSPRLDEAEREREKHETRRLLYVAFTRARDRLYLASALKYGVMAPGRGSLGEVLPESLKALFGRAATAFPQFRSVAWSGTSGRTFEFRLCPTQPDVSAHGCAIRVEATDRSNLIGGARGHSLARPGSRFRDGSIVKKLRTQPRERPSSDLLVGRLVHRLLQLGVPDDQPRSMNVRKDSP